MLKEEETHNVREYLGESRREVDREEIREVSLVTDWGGKVEGDGPINWDM